MMARIRLHNSTRSIIFILIVATVFLFAKLYIMSVNKKYIVYWKPVDSNVSCHYSREGDALPSAEDAGFAPAPRSIFFHETSCRGGLNSRQACAVESAARAHPRHQVHVLFSAPVTQHVLNNSVLAQLQELPNVKLSRVHIEEYVAGIFTMKLLNDLKRSNYSVSHTSDVLRIVSLKKWGGVYLDTDIVVMKSLENLPPNWVAKQHYNEMAFGVLALANDTTGRYISADLIEKMSDYYDPFDHSGNGPGLLDLVIEDLCPESMTAAGGHCNDFYIFNPELFYPIYFHWAKKYFGPGNQDIVKNSVYPYMHHMWNGITWNVAVHKHSPYAKLAKKFCPSVYEMYGNKFGV